MIHYVLPFLLLGCSSFQAFEAPNEKYFVQKEVAENIDKIQQNLEKSNTNAGRRYRLAVMPLPLAVINKLQAKHRVQLPQDKACIQVRLDVGTIEEEARAEFWTAKISGPDEKSTPLTWVKTQKLSPEEYLKPGAYGLQKYWKSQGFMCSDKPFSLSQSFKIVLSSKDVAFPFSKDVSFHWDPVRYNENNEPIGEVQGIQKKQGYRSW